MARRPDDSTPPPTQAVGAVDVAVFAAELAVYAVAGALAWRAHPVFGLLAVLALATWWGLLHSPKARVRLPRAVDRTLRGAWFAICAACALALLIAFLA